ncbi:MAG: hypothetical protein KDC13_01335 [Bacteroidetes bacterium]|nr:hypothetical protein [Bacteroidota bacterium]
MKKQFLVAVICLTILLPEIQIQAQSTEYKVITIVESIVPMGLGRSRLIETQTQVNAAEFTTERTDGKDSKQGKIDRGDAKVDAFSETKLLNFYSGVGINFQNIASNDAIITSKINELSKEGWKLAFVNSGVESDAGGDDGKGIFITRMIFTK